MTTVIANRTAMASDSKITIGSLVVTGPKITRKRGHLIATAGDCGSGEEFIRWFGTKGEKPVIDKDDDFEALVLRPDGVLVYYAKDFEATVMTSNVFAIGSGAMAALSEYINHDASLEQAVAAACVVDANSGLPVQVSLLIPPKAKSGPSRRQ